MQLLLAMEQDLNNFKKATQDQCAKYVLYIDLLCFYNHAIHRIQRLEDNAVKICGKDYEDLRTKMDDLVVEYQKVCKVAIYYIVKGLLIYLASS